MSVADLAKRAGEPMDALTAVLTRVSPARLTDPAPSRTELETILEAGASAPDHRRLKPWRFILIEGEARGTFGEVLAESLRRREPTAPTQKLDAERKKALRAPLIIVAVATVQDHPGVPHIEQMLAVGACVQNILIAIHALGYGGFWRTGAAAYDRSVKDILGLTPMEEVAGYLYVGTISAPGKAREIDISRSVSHWFGDLTGIAR